MQYAKTSLLTLQEELSALVAATHLQRGKRIEAMLFESWGEDRSRPDRPILEVVLHRDDSKVLNFSA